MDQSEARDRPPVSRRDPDDDPAWPAWLPGLKARMAHLPISQTAPRPAPLALSRQLYSKEIFVTKYFPNSGDRQVESVYLNPTHWNSIWLLTLPVLSALCLSYFIFILIFKILTSDIKSSLNVNISHGWVSVLVWHLALLLPHPQFSLPWSHAMADIQLSPAKVKPSFLCCAET